MAPPPSPPIDPFPRSTSITLVDSDRLNRAIAKAVNDVVDATAGKPPALFALSIVDPGDNSVGSFRGDREHYVASMVKVGVLYAAHALRDMVRRYVAARKPASPDALFQNLPIDMNRAIEHSARVILGAIGSSAHRVPNYRAMFSASGRGAAMNVDFHTNYAKALEDMIIPSDDPSAVACIHGLGYSYMNGVLAKHGFFQEKDKKGVWIGGDFGTAWAQARIPCDNDGDTAQGSTTEAMAHLATTIILDDNLPGESHRKMTDLLRRAAHGGNSDPSFLLRPEVTNRLSEHQVSHAKIGWGGLGRGETGPKVYSEVCMLRDIGPRGRSYIVSYANIDYGPYSLMDLVKIIKNAITAYES